MTIDQTTSTETPASAPTCEADLVRGRIRAMWAGVAKEWEANAAAGETRVAAVTETLLAAVAPQPGERVLELASGAGVVGLRAAAAVAPDGEVVISDVVPEMVAIAQRRVEAAAVANATTAVLDLEAIDQPDALFDVVVCQEGVMFAADPAAAATELARVTRPGGRIAVSVWGTPAQNPWLALAAASVSAEVGHPVPPPGGPGPFALGDPDLLRGLFEQAGLTDLTVTEVACPLDVPSFEAWWERTSAIGGPLVAILASMPDDARQRVADRMRVAAAPFTRPDGGIELPGLVLVLSGRRPA